jgi:hypothetical protein
VVERDSLTGRLLPGHQVRPLKRGGPSRAEVVAQYLEPHAKALLDKALDLAKLGDPASLKLVLERLAPVPKQDAERVQVPGLRDAPTLAAKATAILSAVADGTITAEAGDKLLRMLDTYGKAVVLDEHTQRLDALEKGRPALPATVIDLASDDELA